MDWKIDDTGLAFPGGNSRLLTAPGRCGPTCCSPDTCGPFSAFEPAALGPQSPLQATCPLLSFSIKSSIPKGSESSGTPGFSAQAARAPRHSLELSSSSKTQKQGRQAPPSSNYSPQLLMGGHLASGILLLPGKCEGLVIRLLAVHGDQDCLQTHLHM